MAEDEALFDLSLKKKKKKKKTTFDFDGAGEQPESTELAENADEPQSQEIKDESLDFDDFSGMKKKKKKKKATFDMDGLDEALPEDSEGNDLTEQAETTEDLVDMDLDFSLDKKKKKKKKKTFIDDSAIDNDRDDQDMEEGIVSKSGKEVSYTSWSDTDRDYTYDELLTRVFDIMRAKNPDMVAGEKKRIVMRPPQVVRIGTKKSSFVNFAEICKMLHRQPAHLLAFLLAELGTNGSIDGTNQLIIKGRFQQKQIESVLRRYIKEYVTCHTCRSPDTILHKDNRLFFLQCETCHSRCSVANIKSGFQAVTTKRAQMRAKAT